MKCLVFIDQFEKCRVITGDLLRVVSVRIVQGGFTGDIKAFFYTNLLSGYCLYKLFGMKNYYPAFYFKIVNKKGP
jgi:hypothetical protein